MYNLSIFIELDTMLGCVGVRCVPNERNIVIHFKDWCVWRGAAISFLLVGDPMANFNTNSGIAK